MPRQLPIEPMPTHTSVEPPPDDDVEADDDGDGAGDPDDGEPTPSAGEPAPAPAGTAEPVPDPVAVGEPGPELAGAAELLAALPVAPALAADEAGGLLAATRRAREPPWRPAPVPPAGPPLAPPWPARRPAAGPGTTGAAPAGPAAPAAGDEPPGAPPPGTCTIRTDTDASTNSAISTPPARTGSTLPAGCSRITAAALRTPSPALLTTSASMSCGKGSAGP
jgi:hypothetical protein